MLCLVKKEELWLLPLSRPNSGPGTEPQLGRLPDPVSPKGLQRPHPATHLSQSDLQCLSTLLPKPYSGLQTILEWDTAVTEESFE